MKVIVLSLNLNNSLVGEKVLNFIICLLDPLAPLPCQYFMVFLPIGVAGQGCFFFLTFFNYFQGIFKIYTNASLLFKCQVDKYVECSISLSY